MKRSFEKAKKAVERLFRDTCFVETFSEETAAWGESLHEKGEGETFPCRLTEKAEVCGTDGLLTQTEKTVILLYPTEKEIAAGSAVRIRQENGAERRYIAAGESRIFLTHRAVGLRRDEAVFEVTYYCGEEKAAAAECAEALDGLYETLCIIGREERFAASGMQEERTETGIRFTAEYEYHVMLTEETTERMERLKYNGKEAVGYEEKGNIQQRAAE